MRVDIDHTVIVPGCLRHVRKGEGALFRRLLNKLRGHRHRPLRHGKGIHPLRCFSQGKGAPPAGGGQLFQPESLRRTHREGHRGPRLRRLAVRGHRSVHHRGNGDGIDRNLPDGQGAWHIGDVGIIVVSRRGDCASRLNGDHPRQGEVGGSTVGEGGGPGQGVPPHQTGDRVIRLGQGWNRIAHSGGFVVNLNGQLCRANGHLYGVCLDAFIAVVSVFLGVYQHASRLGPLKNPVAVYGGRPPPAAGLHPEGHLSGAGPAGGLEGDALPVGHRSGTLEGKSRLPHPGVLVYSVSVFIPASHRHLQLDSPKCLPRCEGCPLQGTAQGLAGQLKPCLPLPGIREKGTQVQGMPLGQFSGLFELWQLGGDLSRGL